MTTEELLESTLRPSVAVVGNGALGGVGTVIDAFASVIRINLFRTSPFERLCGQRTTHWCLRFHVELPPDRPAGLIPFTPYARPEARRWGDRADIIFARTSMTDLLKKRAPEVLVTRGVSRATWHAETTGFALTVLLLELGFTPTLFGFDRLATGHFFEPSHRHWEGHRKAARELAYFKEWGVLHGAPPGDRA
jgi:hypothetical protein